MDSLEMPSSYREFKPHPALTPFVECYWTLRGAFAAESPRRNRVLPDGCMDILFDLTAAESWVIGPMSESLVVDLMGFVDLLGVRFRPAGLPSFIRLPASELLDRRVDLGAVWGAKATAVQEVLLGEPSIDARIDVLNSMLLRQMPRRQTTAVDRAVAAIQASGGALQIGEMAGDLGLGRRQLERLFATHVGLSPKKAARIIRFRRTIEALLETEVVQWAPFAVECGYYDQAHLIREFRTLAGITPEKYLMERAQTSHVASVQ